MKSMKKEISTQVFSCKVYEIFKNTFFTEHIRTTSASAFKTSNWWRLLFCNYAVIALLF